MEINRTIPEQPANWNDHRSSPRHKVNTLTYVDLGADNGGTLINISELGLSFQGIHPLEPGQMIPIGFKVPGTDRSFKANGKVAWLCDSRKGGGLQFMELPENTRSLIKEWIAAMGSDGLGQQPASLASRIDPEKDHSRDVLRALVQRNRPSAPVNNTLADLIRDSSLSRAAVVAAVNASRAETIAAHFTHSSRTPKFRSRTPVTKSVMATLPAVPAGMPYREQALKASSTVSEIPALGLKAERIGNDWQVRWNRNSDFLAIAVSGNLSITDGVFRKVLEIDPTELRSGSIIYTPATDNVILRLQVVTKNSGQPLSETVRIVACKVL